MHSVVLCVCPLLRRPHVSGALFSLGIVGFSGSCYAAALTQDRNNGQLAPVGGGILMLAWLSLLL